jgi:hypothetical protein
MGTAAIVGGIGLQAYGQYQGLRAAAESAKYDAQVERNNIAIIEEQIKDVTGRGRIVEKQIEQQAVEFIGEQVSAFASSGIDISSAVVGEVTAETAKKAAADMITVQKNVAREVWGLKIGKMNKESSVLFNEARARSARKLAPVAAGATILTGAGSLALRTKTPTTTKSPLTRTKLPQEAFAPRFDIMDSPFI